MKIKKIVLAILLIWLSWNFNAQTNIKLMSYNLLHYPTGTNIDRKDDLRYILNQYQPDIFMVCELENATGADEILNYCLGTQNYEGAYFTTNHSGSQYALQQMLYYNKHKFELSHETYLVTYIRDINHYTLKVKTEDPNNNIFLDIYVGHLKASSGVDNENARRDMVQVLIDDLHNIPNDHFVIFAGDLNLYGSNEPAYQLLINPNNSVVFKDPVNRPGSWHNNIDFKDLDTQSTHSVSDNDYVGGGIDDRFDFIMMSENLFTNPVLYYVNNSYAAYGNNGTCFNKAINSSYCSGATYDINLRQHLYNMSDHLPVVAELETTASLSTPNTKQSLHFVLSPGTIVQHHISLHTDLINPVKMDIYNTIGQKVIHKENYLSDEIINIDKLSPGLYLMHIHFGQKQQLIKFVKTN